MFSICRLHDVMKALPRKLFDDAMRAAGSDRYSKRLDSWSQLTAMLYAQLSGAASLRVMEAAYNSQAHHHYHLGTGAIRRSTLADANGKRAPAPFEAVAAALMHHVPRTLRREGEQLLYLLDSSSITLKGRDFDTWTRATRTGHTQGMKLHVLYEAGTGTPIHHSLSPANVDDILVDFDDERSQAALNALAALADKTQVALFTHHSRVVEQVRELHRTQVQILAL